MYYTKNHKGKNVEMTKKFYLALLMLVVFLLAPNGKQIVFANSFPETIRVIYNFTYIYSVDETVIEATEIEDRTELVAKIAYLHDTFTVTNQTPKMFEIEFEKEEQTLVGYIYKTVVIDNNLISPEKYLQTNASITKQAEVFEKENDNFIKLENLSLEIGTKVRLLETLSNKNEYTLISFNHDNQVMIYYVKTSSLKADGISRSILTAITLLFVSFSAGSVLLTIFKRSNQKKKQALLEN